MQSVPTTNSANAPYLVMQRNTADNMDVVVFGTGADVASTDADTENEVQLVRGPNALQHVGGSKSARKAREFASQFASGVLYHDKRNHSWVGYNTRRRDDEGDPADGDRSGVTFPEAIDVGEYFGTIEYVRKHIAVEWESCRQREVVTVLVGSSLRDIQNPCVGRQFPKLLNKEYKDITHLAVSAYATSVGLPSCATSPKTKMLTEVRHVLDEWERFLANTDIEDAPDWPDSGVPLKELYCRNASWKTAIQKRLRLNRFCRTVQSPGTNVEFTDTEGPEILFGFKSWVSLFRSLRQADQDIKPDVVPE